MTCEVITITDFEGNMKPIKFRINENDELHVIKIDKINKVDKVMPRGKREPIYTAYYCMCNINDCMREIKLIFDTISYRWSCNI